ncbi:Hsp33 family molecular chaperone HslO [Pelagibacterium sp.]|uniref:Hsp33 family molecular chaperone HslO n=1 Tax=Pelagibacterium sp. TaxID=1967288 RepID=UPI003BAA25A5
MFRLYHETGVRVFEPQPLVERCTCSAERVEQMINDFTPEDREEMVVDGTDRSRLRVLLDPLPLQSQPVLNDQNRMARRRLLGAAFSDGSIARGGRALPPYRPFQKFICNSLVSRVKNSPIRTRFGQPGRRMCCGQG